ncbi:hypothetical protein CMV_007550 [Castanea mollissima]|uniref:Uncharacterized protein n=1 Tax=Castanea mollissima TaxID=60419 RepID=A0A8J4VSR0_9ROSI|nr:hypothetical protein CMV_007550 [Castanea mollissima]
MAISYFPRRIIQIFQQILPKGWGNIFRRRVRVFTMALVIYLDYKVLQQREKWASNNTLWEKAHERDAKRVLSLIIELGGLWVKLGQYMSTRADVLPDAYISRLKLLQDSLPPRPLQECLWVDRNRCL